MLKYFESAAGYDVLRLDSGYFAKAVVPAMEKPKIVEKCAKDASIMPLSASSYPSSLSLSAEKRVRSVPILRYPSLSHAISPSHVTLVVTPTF